MWKETTKGYDEQKKAIIAYCLGGCLSDSSSSYSIKSACIKDTNNPHVTKSRTYSQSSFFKTHQSSVFLNTLSQCYGLNHSGFAPVIPLKRSSFPSSSLTLFFPHKLSSPLLWRHISLPWAPSFLIWYIYSQHYFAYYMSHTFFYSDSL